MESLGITQQRGSRSHGGGPARSEAERGDGSRISAWKMLFVRNDPPDCRCCCLILKLRLGAVLQPCHRRRRIASILRHTTAAKEHSTAHIWEAFPDGFQWPEAAGISHSAAS